uniref:CobW C-terminal domain-containing protein n=1 Tax=Chrysotila carterae TaxID=13221 RepID=A0A7S4F2B8_CHRCT
MLQEAVANDWPLMRVVSLQNMVTVVDSASFLELYESDALVRDRPDLGGGAPDESASPFLTEQLDAGDAGVVQLLVEQAEIADVVVLNKADLMSDDEMARVEQIVGAINGFATVLRAEYSKVPLSQLLVQSRELGVAGSNEVMDHKSAVDFAKWLRAEHSSPGAQEHAQADECEKPGCTDPSHDHSHAAAAAPADACADPACTDPAHGHSHSHVHSHSHAEATCSDPACDDPTHDHSHDNRQETTAAARFGIRTFVYSRRKPFDAAKLAATISSLPFTSTLPASLNGYTGADEAAAAKSGDSPFASLVRSKGFVWLSDEPEVAFYWSHAGKRLDLSEMGRWWASIERERWPSLHEDAILEDFDGPNGDRRQELVFIGTALQEAEISAALDACLVEA